MAVPTAKSTSKPAAWPRHELSQPVTTDSKMHAATSSLLLACPTGSRVASSRRTPRHARVRAAASSAASSTSSSTPARLEGEALESYTKKMAEDLTHLFDETGIDRELYESDVYFEDPLTKYDNIDGYLFNINMLKNVFTPWM